MRARLTISILAALALMLAGSFGTAYAQGVSGSDNAGQEQYGTPNDTDVLGEIGEVEEEPSQEAPAPAAEPAAAAQPAAVQQPNNDTLPFTGLETGLIAVLGLALVGGGLMLRRQTASNRL